MAGLIYYDVYMQGQTAKPISKNVVNDAPIISNIQNYDVSVVRASIPMNNIPIFVWPYMTSGPTADGNISKYYVTLEGDYTNDAGEDKFYRYLEYIQLPEISNYSSQPQNLGSANYSIIDFCSYINEAYERLVIRANKEHPQLFTGIEFIRLEYDTKFSFSVFPSSVFGVKIIYITDDNEYLPKVNAFIGLCPELAGLLDGFNFIEPNESFTYIYDYFNDDEIKSIGLKLKPYNLILTDSDTGVLLSNVDISVLSENYILNTGPVKISRSTLISKPFKITLYDPKYPNDRTKEIYYYDIPPISTAVLIKATSTISGHNIRGIQSIYVLSNLPTLQEQSQLFLSRGQDTTSSTYSLVYDSAINSYKFVWSEVTSSGSMNFTTKPILQDFCPDIVSANYNSAVVYNASSIIDSRRITTTSSGPVTNFFISIVFIDNNGTLHDMKFASDSEFANIKLCFIPRQIY